MSELPTFHIRFLFNKYFYTWEELGCLSRALGFPSDLFHRFFQSDVSTCDNKGVSSERFHKMLEQASFHTKLHRSYNMHTAEWNMRVIKQTVNLLEHKALDFDGVYKARVAYTTYEHGDMKGMLLSKNVLLRTLKFCGRVISPMKLMHRVKHMREQLDERGRIQLYEFFSLILWCDLYTSYDSKDVENSSGKVGDLFKIVDFRRLLSHHDERLANRLNDQYVQDERTYGKPSLGGSSKFTDPVVYTAPRIIQVQLNNDKYRQLHQEVTESERRVYQAHAGNIRPRPITAPELSEYMETKQLRDDCGSKFHYSLSSENRRLRSAPARIKSKCPSSSMESHVSRISNAVSADDVAVVKNKMDNLHFDIITLDSRVELNLDAEIDFYLPGYRDRRPSKETAKESDPVPMKKPSHWTTEIIERLTNPSIPRNEFHYMCCDAVQSIWNVQQKRPKTSETLPTNDSSQKISISSENIEDCAPSTNVSDLPPQCYQTTLATTTDDQKSEEVNNTAGSTTNVPDVDTPRNSNYNDDTTDSYAGPTVVTSAAVKTGVRKKVTWATHDIVLPLTTSHVYRQKLISPLLSVQNDEGITCLLNNHLLQDEIKHHTIQDKNRMKCCKAPAVYMGDTCPATSSHTIIGPTTGQRSNKYPASLTSDEAQLGDLNASNLFDIKTLSETGEMESEEKVELFKLESNNVTPKYYKTLSSLQNCVGTENKYNYLRLVHKHSDNTEMTVVQNCADTTRTVQTGVSQAVSVDTRDRQATKKTRRLARSRLLTRIHCARSVWPAVN